METYNYNDFKEWGLVDADAVVARYLPEVQKIAGELMQKIAADEDEQAA